MGFLSNIFKKKKPVTIELPDPTFDDTPGPEVVDSQPADATIPTASGQQDTTVVSLRGKSQHVGKRPLTVGCASHVGRVRQRNEDSILIATSMTSGETDLPPFGLFVVADGMGGHSDGHKASQLASRIVARDVMGQIYPPSLHIPSDPAEPNQPIQDILQESLQAANWQVSATYPESGTTLTAALLLGNRLYLAHVGDSRAYLIPGDAASAISKELPAALLTLDHSFVQRLQDAGQITPEEAAVHPQRNILYRAVGQGEKLKVDTFSRPVSPPGWLLLCSDGLWGVVSAELIHAVITSAANPQQACDKLVEAALNAGGPDNISLIIVRISKT